jgi:arylsulfatase A-like enzyme
MRLGSRVVFILIVASFILTSCNTTPEPDFVVLPKENRPNIVFIVTDDLDAKLNTIDYMKNLQELMIARGTSIDDFLISSSVCCPSRATILRGQYTHSHHVLDNTLPDGGFYSFKEAGSENSTLGVWLQSAGYRTMLMGKYLNGYPYPDDRTYFPPGWTEWYSPGQKNAYDGYDYFLNETGTLVAYPPKEVNYFTDVMSRKSVDFIERAARDDVPFFMYLSSFAPHDPATPARRHLDLFPEASIPLTPSFNEADVSDKPENMRVNPLLTDYEIEKLNEHYRRRLRSMQAVDEMLVEIINVLEKTGQLDNTYIVFTSDNGYHIGQHRLMAGKTTFYEEDIVVPFIVRGPGIPAGKTLTGFLSGNVDIAATIAEWAGVQPPAFVEGRSLAGILAGQPVPSDWRQGFLLEIYDRQDVNSDGVMNPFILASTRVLTAGWDAARAGTENMIGLRTEQYLYSEYTDGFVELYDVLNDPYELDNIAATADPGLLKSLSLWLKAYYSCSGSTCLDLDQGLK